MCGQDAFGVSVNDVESLYFAFLYPSGINLKEICKRQCVIYHRGGDVNIKKFVLYFCASLI